MPKITEIDKNFARASDDGGLLYFDAFCAPLRISGLPFRAVNGNWHRMDDRLADEYNPGVRTLSANTAGVTVSFRTNSKRIAVKVDVECNNLMCHMPYNSSTGIDIYLGSGRNKVFWRTFFVYLNGTNHYEDVRELPDSDLKEVTLHLPLYSGIEKLLIGLEAEATLEQPSPYDYDKPVLFYGSSITQGACASHPGMGYFHMLGRALNIEVINMGFSGAALGEPIMAELISKIPLAAFVFDYDHNAPDAEHLSRTHEPFFETVRAAQPTLPILLISRADTADAPEQIDARRAVIRRTYENAVARGDKNVYFIDGQTIYGDHIGDCTVDALHPNDIGFRRMADAILPVLKTALGE